jgi:tetratricopeptide (TPR) repeat protein
MDRPDLALAAFGSALAARPDDPRALNNRGVALASLGQLEAARADFERALARDPCLFDARLNLHRLGIRAPDPPGCRYTSEQTQALVR